MLLQNMLCHSAWPGHHHKQPEAESVRQWLEDAHWCQYVSIEGEKETRWDWSSDNGGLRPGRGHGQMQQHYQYLIPLPSLDPLIWVHADLHLIDLAQVLADSVGQCGTRTRNPRIREQKCPLIQHDHISIAASLWWELCRTGLHICYSILWFYVCFQIKDLPWNYHSLFTHFSWGNTMISENCVIPSPLVSISFATSEIRLYKNKSNGNTRLCSDAYIYFIYNSIKINYNIKTKAYIKAFICFYKSI